MGFLKAMFDAEYGLVWMNVAAYYKARRQGMTHKSAMRWMLESRYRDDARMIKPLLDTLQDEADPLDELKETISYMLAIEAGVSHDFALADKRENYFDKALATHRRKYPGVL